MDRYAATSALRGDAPEMQNEELFDYLKRIDNFDVSPWVAILSQTEAIGDPTAPSQQHTALLQWLGEALEIWEDEFPLEESLTLQLRQLKPLAAALVIMDPRFLRPGAHPLHQLLDAIHARGIGWQSRMDRVGAVLEQQITQAIESCQHWMTNQSTEIEDALRAFNTAVERDSARAHRMTKRVVETELGKVKTAAAKQEAARMINAALETHPVTAEIGEFITGPWYTSAQLLLLKFGTDSEQWQKMSSTTDTLLDSLQSLEEAPEERRQYIFEVVTQLPKEMRRWLLSLHHDTDAVNDTMGLVEYAHLRILRRQPVELEFLEPIKVADNGNDNHSAPSSNSDSIDQWQEGQWFSIERDGEVTIRVQLALKVDGEEQLLFTNLAGIKVLQLSFSQFIEMLIRSKAVPLYSGNSFSRSLAKAAGIESVDLLEALVEAVGESEPEPAPSFNDEPEPATELEQQDQSQGRADFITGADMAPEPEPEPEPEDLAETAVQSALQAKQASGDESGTESNAPDEPHSHAESTSAAREHLEPAQDPKSLDSSEPGGDTLAAAARSLQGNAASHNEPATPATSAPADSFLVSQAKGLREPDRHSPAAADKLPSAVAPPAPQLETATDYGKDEEEVDAGQEATADPDTEPEADAPEQGQDAERDINLPMGIWLGFHDRETPLMARFAVHDPEEDNFIFVNRRGIKLRQLSKNELLRLIDDDMVEILQRSSDFRDEVSEIKKKQD